MRRTVVFPPPELVGPFFKYDPNTGELTWAKKTRHMSIGDKAGTVTPSGIVITFRGDKIPAQDLCWAMVYGQWPKRPIKFRNGNNQDLRFDNLYEYLGPVLSEDPKAVAMREYRQKQKQKMLDAKAAEAQHDAAELRAQYPSISWNYQGQYWTVTEPIGLPFKLPHPTPGRRVLGRTHTFEDAVVLYERYLECMDILCNVPREPLRPGSENIAPGARGYYTITMQELYDLLYYDMETGMFIWNKHPSMCGLRADLPETNHELSPRYISIRGRKFAAHMLAWFMAYYEWPKPKSIAWTDDNPGNNAIRNLYLKGGF